MTLAESTVLVVEDHEFQRRTMVQMLANLGAAGLLEAADGAAALALVQAGARPDIVVCDLDLPGMDGATFLGHLAAVVPGTAVVIATGLEAGRLAEAAAGARAHGLRVLGAISKPLTARALLEAVGGAPAVAR